MQIRTRLTLQFILLVAGILLLSLCFIHFKFKQIAEREFYDGLRSKALMTAEMVLHEEEDLMPLEATEIGKDSSYRPLPIRENIVIYNSRLQKVFAFNRNMAPLPEKHLMALWGNGEQRFQLGKRLALAINHKSTEGLPYLIVAESEFNAEDLQKLANILLITFFLGIGIVAVGGWIYAGQAMAPVARIINQVDKILPSDLSARLNVRKSHDEIARMALTFNRLLDRIQVAFKMQKSFISNVSHELKNPLSVIISQLEIALDKKHRSEPEYRETLESVLEDTLELNDISEKLLQLARLHSEGGNVAFEKVRLDLTMLQTRASLLHLHPDYQISFDILGAPENEEQLCVQANEPLLRAAFLNLMDNGCKFSPDKKVEAKIFFDPTGQHRVEIADKGPGIPENDLGSVLQPFYRGAQSTHIKGSGIGLSLVDSILRLHHIALEIATIKGKGTTFKLNFPAVH